MTFFERLGLMRPVAGGAFAAANAVITGDVTLEADVGVWFGCVLRGDDAPIRVGARTNVQDLSMIHADPGVPNTIGSEVTIGHRVVLHGASVGDRALIGMGAVVLSGSDIGPECVIAAGTVVTEGRKVPPRSVVMGVPGKVVREVSAEEVERTRRICAHYFELAQRYVRDMYPPPWKEPRTK